MPLDFTLFPPLAWLAGGGIAAGLWLLARGLGGYRTATRIADTGTSSVASMAAGEVRVAGIIEPAEVTLISPLQSERCVYYRATIDTGEDGVDVRGDDEEVRAVGFTVRDATGAVRIFPRGARWDAPVLFDATTGSFGDESRDLDLRRGNATAVAEHDRDTAIAELLSLRPTTGDGEHPLLRGRGSGRRHYTEARLAPGDAVTVVGRALPFSDLADPTESDVAVGSEVAADDPEVLADLAEARAAGLLADDPTDAWGNAAIPGFGIGRPVRAPELDLAARILPLADSEDAARYERTFHIAPTTLILASTPDVPLLIVYGMPGNAEDRYQDRFIVGLLGAILAIASAVIGAIMLGGAFGTCVRRRVQRSSPWGSSSSSSDSSRSPTTTRSWPCASGSTRPGRISTSPSNSAMISSHRWSAPSRAHWPSSRMSCPR